MNRKAWAIFDFSVAACNAACGGVSLHDGRIGSAVVCLILYGALVALGMTCLRGK